ncbi:hypothetical protein AA313_de0205344 [Arthrobotrys entomopaga]|nr:hypothetical protein AA313_de0205344 [Arthrobotrys entomopaga]
MQTLSFSKILFLCFVFVAQASAWPISWTIPFLGLGTRPPPAEIRTTDISPQCSANNGSYLCCAATFDGGIVAPLVGNTTLVDYQLPANTLNGFGCSKKCDQTSVRVCCQVTILLPAWGLWCQPA